MKDVRTKKLFARRRARAQAARERAGTPGRGEDVCPNCGGSGRTATGECLVCKGTGKATSGIGGA
jgi:DnaJ-class molecular chaperone